jgi:hypothetical protein
VADEFVHSPIGAFGVYALSLSWRSWDFCAVIPAPGVPILIGLFVGALDVVSYVRSAAEGEAGMARSVA